jgi:hypothetical protein
MACSMCALCRRGRSLGKPNEGRFAQPTASHLTPYLLGSPRTRTVQVSGCKISSLCPEPACAPCPPACAPCTAAGALAVSAALRSRAAKARGPVAEVVVCVSITACRLALNVVRPAGQLCTPEASGPTRARRAALSTASTDRATFKTHRLPWLQTQARPAAPGEGEASRWPGLALSPPRSPSGGRECSSC